MSAALMKNKLFRRAKLFLSCQIVSVAPNCFGPAKLLMSRQIAYVPSNCFYTTNCFGPAKLLLHPKLLSG